VIQQLSINSTQSIISPGYSSTLESIFPPPRIAELSKERSEQSSVYLLPLNQIDYLENIYIFENPKEVKRFLLSNTDLIEILLEAHEHIFRIFGHVPICLELHHDPEEDWNELFIVIKSSYKPEKAIELEERLFNEWFIRISNKVAGRLNFTEEPL